MRAGAAVESMEMVQFHPTALVHPGKNGRFFLISEALRGEGAILRNRKWEAFMTKYHPLADLAPRDIVSRAIITEMRKHDLPNVYLDITHKSRGFLENRFPTIYNECMSRDIDIAISWIPVVPVQHYFMGGVKTDTGARTGIRGLYACGETACTGVHGANRLASNSLLECLVFGRRAAEDISVRPVRKPEYSRKTKIRKELDIPKIRYNIREAMTKKSGIIRNATGLGEAAAEIQGYYDELSVCELKTSKEIETLNMATVSGAVLDGAIKRKNSVGAHFRNDEPKGEN
jgi:L-aspartate oxidase